MLKICPTDGTWHPTKSYLDVVKGGLVSDVVEQEESCGEDTDIEHINRLSMDGFH